jgi:hypothetical protein
MGTDVNPTTETPAAVVRARGLARSSSSSRAVQAQWRPLPVDHVEQARLGRALRLTTVGRKSGQERSVIIGYVEDGPNLVVLEMNGWNEGHPSRRLNLQAHPDAVVRLAGQRRARIG